MSNHFNLGLGVVLVVPEDSVGSVDPETSVAVVVLAVKEGEGTLEVDQEVEEAKMAVEVESVEATRGKKVLNLF